MGYVWSTMSQDRSSKGSKVTSTRANLADERSPSSGGNRDHPKAGYMNPNDRSRSSSSRSERDQQSNQRNPNNPSSPSRQTARTSQPRPPNKDRAAQEAHREFMRKLAKTRGKGFVWSED